jgi:AraC family transcriptional regulator of adaptative response / DNA-3-methyladenine glycosylase II
MPPLYKELELSYRPPLDWDSIVGFLGARAVAGVESVEEGHFRRSVRIGQKTGVIDVSKSRRGSLILKVSSGLSSEVTQIASRVRGIFDLDADPSHIAAHLGRDRKIGRLVRLYPGLRVPGAWDGFEIGVRAIVGQQVSVRAATTVCGRIAEAYGDPLEEYVGGLRLLFPSAKRLSKAGFEGIGLTSIRIDALRRLAREVDSGALAFSKTGDLNQTIERLTELPGVGPWTANYIAMRAFSEPDAFPSSDLILRRAAAGNNGELLAEGELLKRAERWRPLRAYAAIYLWTGYANESANR